MTKNRNEHFSGIFGLKSHEENILVEMCSDEFFLTHALGWSLYLEGSKKVLISLAKFLSILISVNQWFPTFFGVGPLLVCWRA